MSVFVDKEKGSVQYIGHTDFAPGVWLGVKQVTTCSPTSSHLNTVYIKYVEVGMLIDSMI